MPTITKHIGVAGQVSFVHDDNGIRTTLVGSVYGSPGPVVLITSSGAQVFITEPSRFGDKFNRQYAERFFTPEPGDLPGYDDIMKEMFS